MKSFFRWFKSGRQHKYINGGKGVISIFLAVLMLPFLTMADFLVESGRYHEAVSLLDESMDSAALSTLSYYDQYLMERFGLMSISQDVNIGQTYQTYLNDNLSSISSWDIGTQVTADFALSDKGVLMQQIEEISKFSAPTALASDLKLSDLIAELNDICHLGSFFSVIKSTGDAVDDMLTVSEDIEALLETAKKLEEYMADYDKKYKKFEEAVKKLVEALKVQAKCQKVVDQLEKALKWCHSPHARRALKAKLKIARKALDAAKKVVSIRKQEFLIAKENYIKSIQKVIPELPVYQEKVEKLLASLEKLKISYDALVAATDEAASSQSKKNLDLDTAINGLMQQIKDCENGEQKKELEIAMNRLTSEKSEIDASSNTIDGIGDTAMTGKNSFLGTVNEALSGYNKDKVNESIKSLNRTLQNVINLQPNDITEHFKLDKSKYYTEIKGLVSADIIKNLMDALEDTLQGEGFLDTIEAMSSIYEALFTSSGICDTRLDAYIKEDANYAESDLDLVLKDISNMLKQFDCFQDGIVSGLVKLLANLSDIFHCLCDLAEHLVDYLVGITVRAVTALRELLSEQCGEKFLLDEYLLKTLANRNDMSDGTIQGKNDFTGFDFAGVPFEACESSQSAPITGGLESIIRLLQNIVDGGNDVMFKGAELEYILVGSRSETINQTVIFMNLYFVRLIADMGKILINGEVKEIAMLAAEASYGIGGVIVYLLYILVEPLLDCIFIVNKRKVSLFKSIVYLTPSGIMSLLEEEGYLGVSEADKNKIKDKSKVFKRTKKLPGSVGVKGVCWDYENYLFAFMLLFGENETYLFRTQNIITLEANEHYGQQTFNLNDAYTYLEAGVDGEYNPVLPLGSISTNGIFSISRNRSRGY